MTDALKELFWGNLNNLKNHIKIVRSEIDRIENVIDAVLKSLDIAEKNERIITFGGLGVRE